MDYCRSRPVSPEQSQDVPSYKFVMWEHLPENVDAAAAQLAECNVVAIELVCPDQATRQEYEWAATTLVSSTATARQQRKAAQTVSADWYPVIYKDLLFKLKGSDKRIITLDMNRDDPDWADRDIALEEHVQAWQAARHNYPSEKVAQHILNGAEVAARVDTIRDAKAVAQIHDIAATFKGSDVRVGILYGASHTSIYNETSRHYPSERVFVAMGRTCMGGKDGVKYTFDYKEQVYRAVRMGGSASTALNKFVLNKAHGVTRRTLDIMPKPEIEAMVRELDVAKDDLSTIGPEETQQRIDQIFARHGFQDKPLRY